MYHISNDIRSKQSAERIYEALNDLLSSHSLEAITITKLVKKAQVGRTTFYRCFDSIVDVLKYKCDCKFIACGEFLFHSIIIDKRYTVDGTFMEAFLDYWINQSHIIQLLMKVDQTQFLQQSFKNMIDLLIVKYPFIKDKIPYFDYFIAVRSSIAIAILTQWIENDFDLSPKEIASILKKDMIFDEFLYSMIED